VINAEDLSENNSVTEPLVTQSLLTESLLTEIPLSGFPIWGFSHFFLLPGIRSFLYLVWILPLLMEEHALKIVNNCPNTFT
jgi:hypothetical protein